MSATAETRQLCTFGIGEHWFGIEAGEVQEILKLQGVTPVPLAPDSVRGLINLRGQLVTAVDLRARLGIAPVAGSDSAPARASMNVVVPTPGGLVSLVVDRIGDVVEAQASAYEPPPPTLGGQLRELISGIYKFEGYLLLVLDLVKVIQLKAKGG